MAISLLNGRLDYERRDSGIHKAIVLNSPAHGSSASSFYCPGMADGDFRKELSSTKELYRNDVEKLLRYAYRNGMAVLFKQITIETALVDASSIQGVDERAATLKDPRGLHA